MFSEYASRYFSRSQKAAPLFHNDGAPFYLDPAAFGSTDLSLSSGSDSDSLDSDSGSEMPSFQHQQLQTNSIGSGSNFSDPPSDFLVASRTSSRPHSRKRAKPRQGTSLFAPHTQPKLPTPPKPPAWFQRHAHFPKHKLRQVTTEVQQHSSPHGDAEQLKVREGFRVEHLVGASYLLLMALSLATAVLVSAAPGEQNRWAKLLLNHMAGPVLGYSLLAAVLAAAWLRLLRSYARAMVQTLVLAVPIVLCLFSASLLAMSTHRPSAGIAHGGAHALMRVAALAPLVAALAWVLYLRRMKSAVGKAGEIIAVCAEVYGELRPVITTCTLVMGAFSLQLTCFWGFLLANAFLEGRVGYLLVAWFSFLYVWTCGVVMCLLRSVLACVVNELYKVDQSSWSKKEAFGRGVWETMSFHFGTACTCALASTRLPFFRLPFRLPLASWLLGAVVTDQLQLPTAVLERCSLANATEVLASSRFRKVDRNAYQLSKWFLNTGRLLCSVLVALVAWGHADRINDASSAYACVVAAVGLCVGYTAVGTSENMLGFLCDSLLVCFVLNEESPRRAMVKHLFTSDELLAAEVSNPADDTSDFSD